MNKWIKTFFVFLIFLLPVEAVNALSFNDNQTVDHFKNWTIHFNKEIQFDDLTKKEIIVTDSSGKKIDVYMKVGKDNKSIVIYAPSDGYTPGESYTLKIGSKIHSKDGTPINKDITLNFNIPKIVGKIIDEYRYTNQGQAYTLPTLVSGFYYASWMPAKADTSKAGTYIFEGTVKGYDKKVKLTLNVRGKQLTTKEIVDKYGNAIVHIYAQDSNHKTISSGSGFLIESSGTLVTTFHLIDGASYAKVILKDGSEYEVESVLNYNRPQDIAILKLKNNIDNLPTLSLGEAVSSLKEENVVAIGNPDGFSNSVSEGIRFLSGATNRYPRVDLKTSMSIDSGSKGGALLNVFGEVIGITYKENFSIPIHEVKELLDIDPNPISLKELNAPPLSKDIPLATGLKAWRVGAQDIFIQWDENKNTDGCYVYFSYDGVNWYYLVDDNGNKKLFYWADGHSSELSYLPPEQTVYIKVTSVKNRVESGFSNIIMEKTSVDFFYSMKTVPQPYIFYDEYAESSSEPGLCRYSYSVSGLPATFFEDYFSTLEKYGWKYSHTYTREDGTDVVFFTKDKLKISIKIDGDMLNITGNMH